MPVAKIFYCPEIGWSQSFSVLEQGWCFLPIRSSHLWNRVAAIYSWPWTGLLLSSPYLLQGCHNLLSTLKRVATIFSVPGTGWPQSSQYLEQGCHCLHHTWNKVATIFYIPVTGLPIFSPYLEQGRHNLLLNYKVLEDDEHEVAKGVYTRESLTDIKHKLKKGSI